MKNEELSKDKRDNILWSIFVGQKQLTIKLEQESNLLYQNALLRWANQVPRPKERLNRVIQVCLRQVEEYAKLGAGFANRWTLSDKDLCDELGIVPNLKFESKEEAMVECAAGLAVFLERTKSGDVAFPAQERKKPAGPPPRPKKPTAGPPLRKT